MVAQAAIACTLCGLPTAHPLTDESGSAFCCPACQEVSRLLSRAEGVRGDGVAQEPGNLPAGTSTPSDLETSAPSARAETAGRPQAIETICLGGLWCTSCGWLIGERLRRTPGVHQVDVSFIQREARVVFDPNATRPRDWVRQIRRIGYRAWLPGDPPFDEEEAHYQRLLVSGVLAMHIMLISLTLYVRQGLGWASPDTAWLVTFFQIILFIASLPIMLLLGLPILRAGTTSLLRLRPNLHTLIAIGAFSAFGLSVRNLVLGMDRVYFDTASMLLFLVALGRWLEIRAQKTSGRAVERLWEQMPEEATWITPDGERRVPLAEVPKGARVRVRPGERFPVDGVVAAGQGDVDESLLTGEPTPVTRRPGTTVLAGTISLDGAFEVIASAIGAETVAGQIGRLLHHALWQRAPVERLADRLARLMVPAAVALAAGTFVFWSVRAGTETALLHALSVLLIACPCALGIATPLTLWLGLGRAAEAGVLLRSTGVLEHLAGVRHLFFDKTGTLTRPPLRLHAVAPNGCDAEAFLARVAAVEAASEHPLAQAVVQAARERDLALPAVTHFRALPGQGVSGRLNGTHLWVGNRHLMEDQALALPASLAMVADEWQQQGLCVVYAGWEDRVAGLLGLGEQVRPGAAEAISDLQAMGLDVVVLTGDDMAAGERWQRLLGVPVYAEQRPENKMARLREVEGPVAMVGDGINDGPALAAARVGLALSQGTDVARTAADAILLNDDLRAVPWLLGLSRMTMKRVHQNLGWAFVYNLAGLALAVTGHLQPVLAAAAMVASSLIVTGNALRLRSFSARFGS